MTRLTDIAFAPLLPWPVIAVLAALALIVLGLTLFTRARGGLLRGGLAIVLLAALANPSLVEEERRLQDDVALVVVDESPSMDIGDRRAERDAALEELEERIGRLPGLELRVLRAGAPRGVEDTGTELFSAMREALADVPARRRAGTVMITDGQVHDAPDEEAAEAGPPLHALLVGRPDERDRRLTVVRAPAYGIVGDEVQIDVRVDDLPGTDTGEPVELTLRVDAGREFPIQARTGVVTPIPVAIDRAGQTVVELTAAPAGGELTLANNRVVVAVNGVRDRLRVLLISGQPHTGERVWRNLLKSDPAVDLVHFTILRPPEKQDATPIRELSLIAFPIRELFEEKLEEFDLIVFDRYERRGLIPPGYLANIADYVQRGGALLEAVGPGFAEPFLSLYRTPIGEVLPGEPTGSVIEAGFSPQVTELGARHPVTGPLLESNPGPWGRWFRLVEVEPRGGQPLMTGTGDRPVLLLDRVGEGRVGQVLSDQIWLWARGFEGGGPHGEMLRRLAHWLMKEPDLEEEALTARVAGRDIVVERRSLDTEPMPVRLTGPAGQVRELVPEEQSPGLAVVRVEAEGPGIYRVDDGANTTVVAVGALNTRELADPRATTERLAPAVAAASGRTVWLSETGVPDLRRIRPGRDAGGRGWIGLAANEDYIVAGVRELPLLPPWAALALALALAAIAWRREAD